MSGLARRWAAWAPLVRIARRDALRARGRSALIVAMVALPILALTMTDVLARSAQLEPGEKAARRLGQTQAYLETAWGAGGPVLQAPDPHEGATQLPQASDGPGEAVVDPASLTAAVPAGYRALTSRFGEVVARTREGLARTEWSETAVGDPAFRGRYVLRQGAAPSSEAEVAVTSDLFDRLGVPVGGSVTLDDPERTVRLTGVVDQVGAPAALVFWAQPGSLLGDDPGVAGQSGVFLVGNAPVTWRDVMALNQRGLLVTSRAVLLEPPAHDAVPYYTEGNDAVRNTDFWFFVMLLAVVVVLAALEVTLLAGAAFAVGARRQARSLGLLAAAGGSRHHVRSVVLAGGLVLGAAGAVIGVALGLVAAALAKPVLTDVAQADFGHFDVRPLELLAIALLGLGTGVLAAVLPARTAARQDPVVALTGRRGQVRTPRKVPVIGVVLTVVGVGCAALGSTLAVALTTGFNPLTGGSTAVVAGLIAGGAALAQIGLIVTSPAIIGLAGRWSRRLPLAGRLALRDAARHRGRSAPAVAAVLTAVTGSTALVLYVAALDVHDREQYVPSWPAMTGGVQLQQYDVDPATGQESRTYLDPDRVLAALAPELPPFEAQVVRTTDVGCEPGPDGTCVAGFAQPVVPAENECPLAGLDREATAEELARVESDPRCGLQEGLTSSWAFAGVPVGGADVARLVAGRAVTAEAQDALQRGGVVVFSPQTLRADGTVRFDVVTDAEAAAAEQQGRAPQARQVTVPGAYLPTTSPGAEAVYSPAAAHALGLRTAQSVLLLHFDMLPTTGEEEAAAQALDNAGVQTWFSVERGYVSTYGLGLLALVVGAGVITLGSAGIATGLAQADARADHATLAAVGAAPRLRRTLAAAQALTISCLGTALGVAAGFVPAVALIGAIPSLDLVVPWWQLAQVMVVVPLLAGLFAWLLTRSRVPLERRVA